MIRFILWGYFCINFVKPDIFSSVSKMQMLANLELDIFKALQRFIQDSNAKDIAVEDYLRQFESQFLDQIKTTSHADYAEHPVNAFHLLMRVHGTWERILSAVYCEDCELTAPMKEFQATVWTIEKNASIFANVTSSEVEWAAMALVRLWQTYKLDLHSLFSGQIWNSTTDALSCDEVLYICNILDTRNEFYKEILWLQQMLDDITNGQTSCSSKQVQRVKRNLAAAYFQFGMPWMSVRLTDQFLVTDPSDVKFASDLQYYKMKVDEIPETERTKQLQASEEDLEQANYEALCRGQGHRKIKTTSRLRCIYRGTRVPYYTVKEEILSISPRISLFYEVITESEIRDVKGFALNMLKTSIIVGGLTEYKTRVSQTAWMPDEMSPVIKRISSRVQLITGLSTAEHEYLSDAENLQVLNYGIGGMYHAHHDYFSGRSIGVDANDGEDPPHLIETGDRIATWMFYLSDVKAGGATVFTIMNITVPVQKGAAAFWYNFKRNGEPDVRTQHAGCPVLLGSKWVANKWIRQGGQIFNRKCGKSYHSIDNFFLDRT